MRKFFDVAQVVAPIVLVSLLFAVPAQADPIKFARYPHSSNGQIAFSYHGDIWVADDDGGNARRLTAHVANDTFPRFSPDGQWIAFTSNRMGNNDVFVVSVNGGVPRQLTFHTTSDTVLYWTPDGQRIIFATSRGSHAFISPLYTVSPLGDLPAPMDMDQGAAGMISQDGGKVAFNRYGMRYWRKGYRGNSQTDIWLQDLASKEITQLTDADTEEFRGHTQDAYPMWGADGMVYFMSERDGIFNIWKIAADGSGLTQVTDHGSDGVQYPSMSPDGTTITYENEFEVWKLAVPNGTPERVSIDLDFDRQDQHGRVPPARESGRTASTPRPRAATWRWTTTARSSSCRPIPRWAKRSRSRRAAGGSARRCGRRMARSSPTSPTRAAIRRCGCTTSRHGRQDAPVQTTSRRRARPIWAPDSSKLAFSAFNSLFVADVASGDVTEVGTNPERGFQIGNFSADGNWLVYSRRNEDLNQEVYLFEIATRAEHNVTQDPFTDSAGHDHARRQARGVSLQPRADGTNQLFKVSLARLTEDPDDPLVKERKLLEAERIGARWPVERVAVGVGYGGAGQVAVRPGRR